MYALHGDGISAQYLAARWCLSCHSVLGISSFSPPLSLSPLQPRTPATPAVAALPLESTRCDVRLGPNQFAQTRVRRAVARKKAMRSMGRLRSGRWKRRGIQAKVGEEGEGEGTDGSRSRRKSEPRAHPCRACDRSLSRRGSYRAEVVSQTDSPEHWVGRNDGVRGGPQRREGHAERREHGRCGERGGLGGEHGVGGEGEGERPGMLRAPGQLAI